MNREHLTFLIEILKKKPLELRKVLENTYPLSTLGTFTIDDLPLETLLFQTGYLTIKEYNSQFDGYRLGYANEEIKQSLSIIEMSVLTKTELPALGNILYKLRFALEEKNIAVFLDTIQGLFASIPYNLHIDREAYYHSLFQLLCNVLDLEPVGEQAMSTGKIDLKLITSKYAYFFEFKLNRSGKAALAQIKNKRYYAQYVEAGKEIILVGISFNFKKKELSLDWVAETLTKNGS